MTNPYLKTAAINLRRAAQDVRQKTSEVESHAETAKSRLRSEITQIQSTLAGLQARQSFSQDHDQQNGLVIQIQMFRKNLQEKQDELNKTEHERQDIAQAKAPVINELEQKANELESRANSPELS